MKRYAADWKLLSGFSALLLLMITIGLIGILQIQSLTKTVDRLGKHYLPMQKATLEMRISNNLYAMGIRNYVFWKSSRYLEAARAATDLGIIQRAAEEFDYQLAIYTSHIESKEQREWIDKIAVSEEELREMGLRIISLVDQNASAATINKLIMTFESRLHKIDGFLDETVQKDNLNAVNEQLQVTNLARKRAILFLSLSLVFGVLIGGETAWLVYSNLKREYQRRQNMISQMIRMEERERQNLSAQIHDQMSQDLGAVKIYLGLIEQAISSPSEQLGEKLAHSKRIISGLIEKSHNISLLLRPPALDEVGLVDSLEALMIDYKRLTGVDYTFQKPERELKLSPEYSLFLYRFIQEVLTNAAKYAQAKNVHIRLTKTEAMIELSYKDDGKGFDYYKLLKQPRRRTEDKLKLGLFGLKERAELLGGEMRIDTALGKGTHITVKLGV